jgi:LPXTG-site transpeptidase (sortase) family protein
MRQKHFSSKGRGVSLLWAVQAGCLLLTICLTARPVGRLVKRQVIAWKAADTRREWKAVGRESRSGDPQAWLTAKDAGISMLVLYDATKENLNRFPCWSTFGEKPEGRGLKIIQAHRDTHFRHLGQLKINSAVEVEWAAGVAHYRVIDIEILDPQQAEVRLRELATLDRLVLMTCYPFRYIGPAPQCYLVWLN